MTTPRCPPGDGDTRDANTPDGSVKHRPGRKQPFDEFKAL